MGFKSKIFLFVPIIIIPLFIMGVVSFWACKSSIGRANEHIGKLILDQVAREALLHIQNGGVPCYASVDGKLTICQEEIVKYMQAQSIPPFSFYVLQTNGVAVYHPERPGANLAAETYVKKILEKKSGKLRYLDKGKGRLIGWGTRKVAFFEYIPQWQWVIVAVAPESKFGGPASMVRITALLSCTLGLALALMLIAWILRSMVQIKNDLIAGMHAAGQGDFTRRLVSPQQDLFGEIINAYNQMTGALRNRLKKPPVSEPEAKE